MKRTFSFLLIIFLTTSAPIRSSLEGSKKKYTDENIQFYLAPTSLAQLVHLEQKQRPPLSLNLWQELKRVILEEFCGPHGLALKIGSTLVHNRPRFINGTNTPFISARKLKRLTRLMELILPILLNDVTREDIVRLGQYEDKSPFTVKMSKTKSGEVELTFSSSGPGLPASHLHYLLNPSVSPPPAPFFLPEGEILGAFYDFLSQDPIYGTEEKRTRGSVHDKNPDQLFKRELEAALSKENPEVSRLMEMLEEGENPGTGLSEIENLFGPGNIKVALNSVWIGDLEADSINKSGITLTLTFHPNIDLNLPDLAANRICDRHL